MKLLRRLTYNKFLKEVARSCGVNDVLRNWYYQVSAPRDGIITASLGSSAARFHVRTPLQMRTLDPAGEMGFERLTLVRLLSLLDPGDIFYDIGANFGLYSVFAALQLRDSGQVIAFEPDSRSRRDLADNAALNALQNLRCMEEALGEHDTEATLYHHKEGPGTSTLLDSASPAHAGLGHQTVRVVHGDTFVRQQRLPLPTAVKLDVEGFEIAVLDGLRETLSPPAVRLLCCEVHPHMLPSGQTPEDVEARLRKLGFRDIEHLPGENPTYHVIAQR